MAARKRTRKRSSHAKNIRPKKVVRRKKEIRPKQKPSRAQAATEFILTYAWVLVAIGVVGFNLIAFGVLDPSSFIIPETCNLGPGFHCNEFVAYYYESYVQDPFFTAYDGSGIIALEVTNSKGQDITELYIMIDPEEDYCGGYMGIGATPGYGGDLGVIKNGESRVIKFLTDDTANIPACEADANCAGGNYYPNEAGFPYTCVDGLCMPVNPYPIPLGPYQPLNGIPCSNDPQDPDPCLIGFECISEDGHSYEGYCVRETVTLVSYLICGCPFFMDVECNPAVPSLQHETFNCCDSSFAENVMGSAGGFCPGYNVSADEVCNDFEDVSNENFLNLGVRVFYKFSGSSFMHSQEGTIRVKNAGPFVVNLGWDK